MHTNKAPANRVTYANFVLSVTFVTASWFLLY